MPPPPAVTPRHQGHLPVRVAGTHCPPLAARTPFLHHLSRPPHPLSYRGGCSGSRTRSSPWDYPGPPRWHVWGLVACTTVVPWFPQGSSVMGLGLSPAQHLPSPTLAPHLPHHASLSSVCPWGPPFPHSEREMPPTPPAPHAPAVPVRFHPCISACRAGFGPNLGHCSLPGAGCCGVGGSTHRHPHPLPPLQSAGPRGAPAAGPQGWSCSRYGNRLHRAGCRGHPSLKWHTTRTGGAGGCCGWGGWLAEGPPGCRIPPGSPAACLRDDSGGIRGICRSGNAARGHVGPALSPCAEAQARGGHGERGSPLCVAPVPELGPGLGVKPPPSTWGIATG